MIKEYYQLEIKFGENPKKYYIWCNIDEINTFFTENGEIVSFLTEFELLQYCKANSMVLITEGDCIEIPDLKRMYSLWKNHRDTFCHILLNAWNIAIDINKTFNKKNPYLDGCDMLYDKIFRANNISAFLAENDPLYIPHFSKREQKQLARILAELYQLFEEQIK